MKPHFGLKFAALIGVMLCAAIAVRVLAANKEKTTAQFKVTISSPAQTNCKDLNELKQKLQAPQALVEREVCLDWNDNNGVQTWCPKRKKKGEKSAPTQTFSPPPHIQQTVEFTNSAGLKALADALAPAASPPAMRTTSTPTMSPPPPPPHIQQTAGMDSTQRDKVIAEALQR